MTYIQHPSGQGVIDTLENAIIHPGPSGEWAAYQDWLAAGNTPGPAPEPTPETPSPDWRGFLAALRDTSAFLQLRGAARIDVATNALATELRLALGEAALGMVDLETVQTLLNELWPTLSSEDRATVMSLISGYHIPLQGPA
jgi:hypothetical protein